MLKIIMAINWEFIEEVGALRWMRRTLLRQFSKRVLRVHNTIMLPTGLRMRLPRTSKFATEVFITGANVDWGSEKLFSRHLDRSAAVLDIGANVGYYSLYVLPLVSAVHAFEPDPRVLAALRSNLASHSNAHVHNLAVGNLQRRAWFALAPDSEVSHLVDASIESIGEPHEIDVTTIDSFVAGQQLSVTGIKIDVEGADIDVLAGGLATLGSQFPLVLAETEPNDSLWRMIRPLEYRIFAFVRNTSASRFVFREISEGKTARTKMLFLVPKRLHQEFERVVSEQSV